MCMSKLQFATLRESSVSRIYKVSWGCRTKTSDFSFFIWKVVIDVLRHQGRFEIAFNAARNLASFALKMVVDRCTAAARLVWNRLGWFKIGLKVLKDCFETYDNRTYSHSGRAAALRKLCDFSSIKEDPLNYIQLDNIFESVHIIFYHDGKVWNAFTASWWLLSCYCVNSSLYLVLSSLYPVL